MILQNFRSLGRARATSGHTSAAVRTRVLTTALTTVLAAGLLAGCAGTEPAADTTLSAASATSASPSASASADVTEWSYEGQDGRTALDLLLESDPSAEVSGEGEMAYVTSIGGRAADDAAKEFWALYVDGAMATVGAGSLVTTTGQEITWKLETY
ncbi:DUF4430 domain-containing protein [Antribacter sp. KLBMP9083]|uniref:DUF4430 domain-containing protein n=1 Tax=Antribacter soli TaxID=2910976 RepID=A0AA41QI80_9MICO|nr:DUF4430 domain-containing protein [Antribacter soli]MCF4122589.1 DUF4430 domain-containing protein [Antribacter soli]